MDLNRISLGYLGLWRILGVAGTWFRMSCGVWTYGRVRGFVGSVIEASSFLYYWGIWVYGVFGTPLTPVTPDIPSIQTNKGLMRVVITPLLS